jgi:hypothetical protein
MSLRLDGFDEVVNKDGEPPLFPSPATHQNHINEERKKNMMVCLKKNSFWIGGLGLLVVLLMYSSSPQEIVLSAAQPLVTIELIGRYESGAAIGSGGAEIVAVHTEHDTHYNNVLTAYVVNGAAKALDIVNVDDPVNARLQKRVDLSTLNGQPTDGPTSVAVDPADRGVAVAVPNVNRHLPGWVVLMGLNGEIMKIVEVGALPDMLTFTPSGSKILVANEGEPAADYSADPEGSVSIIDVTDGLGTATVTTARFENVPAVGEARVFGPNTNPAQNYEPEYITVAPDGRRAFVSLQENNAIAELDPASGQFTVVRGLGYKDYSVAGHELDASDRDGRVNMRNWPVFGMYQPDAIASYTVEEKTYLITANEGDARDYSAYSEQARVRDLMLDPAAFPAGTDVKRVENLGRLRVTNALGDRDGDGDLDRLYAFGARSFSIFDANDLTAPVFDSGSAIERRLAEFFPADFNCDNDENQSFDSRSDDKGPEPEGVVLGDIEGRTFAFIGLERIGGVLAYDVSDPSAPVFAGYANNRNFAATEALQAGDLGPEGLAFVPAIDSPTGEALVLVANEISGTVSIYAVRPLAQ